MNSFLSLLPVDGWPRLLCDALWQSTLIGVLGLLIARYFVRPSAAKAWVLLLSLSACLLVPLASLSARSAGLGMLKSADSQQFLRDDEARIRNLETASVPLVDSQETSTPIASNEDRAALAVGDRSENELSSTTPQSSATPVPAVGRWMFFSVDPDHVFLLAFAILWCAASTLLLGRFMLGGFATWRLVRRADVCTDAALRSAAAAAAGRVGLGGTPNLLVSREITTPMILALGRPRLLVPATIGESRTDWVATFTHELAHAVRGDSWSRLWSETVLIALPLQPFVWLLRRRFHTACEEACDDWAVAMGSDPVEFADSLTQWIRRSRQSALLATIGMSSTKARMLRLLNLKGKPAPQLRRSWRWTAALAAVLMLAGLAVAQTQTEQKDEPKAPEIMIINSDSMPAWALANWGAGNQLQMGVNSHPGLRANWPIARAQSTDHDVVELMPSHGSDIEIVPKKAGRAVISLWNDRESKYEVECVVDERPTAKHVPEEVIEQKTASDDPLAQIQRKLTIAAREARDLAEKSKLGEDDPAVKKSRKYVAQLQEKLDQQKAELQSEVGGSGQVAQAKQDEPRPESAPKEDEIEKRLNDDSLVIIYSRRIATNQELLDAIKAGKEQGDEQPLRDDIKSTQERIEKRKAEIRPLILERLRLAQRESKSNRSSGGSADLLTRKPYIVEPPDIITLDPVQLVPKKPVEIAPLDKVKIVVEGTKFDLPISGNFQVDSSGDVVLGPGYGAVKITGLTRREAEEAVTVKLQETLNNPQVALIIDESRLESGIKGDHLVGPDGTITLGTYGSVYVAGLTIAQARQAIENSLRDSFASPKVSVEVKSFNSQVYYVIVEGAVSAIGSPNVGDSIYRYAIKGNERVLDAIAQVGNLSGLSDAKIWIARPNPNDIKDENIRIDWNKALEGNKGADPQLMPGDRLFIYGAKRENYLQDPSSGSIKPTPAKPQY